MPHERAKARAFERRWKRRGSVVCDLWKREKVEGGAAGDSFAPTLKASDVHVIYEQLSQNAQMVVGGQAHLASHQLELAKSASTLAITPEYTIRIQPIDDPIFERPLRIENIDDATVKIAATLVQEGYRQ